MLLNTRNAAITTTLAAALVSTAAAQTITGGWELSVSGTPVSPSNPVATIQLWAWWDDNSIEPHVFGGGNLDLVAASGEFLITHCASTSPHGCGYHNIVGNRVNDISDGQLHLPPLGIYGKRDNPFLILDAEWTTTDFTTVRTVDLWTENTNNFIIADWATGATTQLYPGGFITGAGVIQVIPAPPVMWTAIVLALCGTSRRRGCN